MTATTAPTIRIHPEDNVVIARRQLLGGTVLTEEGVTVAGLVPPGHKVATQAIAAGEAVRRYNQIIGHATQAIAPGQHVHVLAGCDGLRGVADDLVVAPYRLAGGDGLGGHLVAGRHEAGHGHAFLRQHRTAQQLAPGDDDVVLGVDADGRGGGRGHGQSIGGLEAGCQASMRAGSQA